VFVSKQQSTELQLEELTRTLKESQEQVKEQSNRLDQMTRELSVKSEQQDQHLHKKEEEIVILNKRLETNELERSSLEKDKSILEGNNSF
jgi:predicted RNase H-like nuclease (RuvC/YqgF family)